MPQLSQNGLTSQLDSALVSLGLSLSERELYATSLAMGALSVSELAKQLGLQRPYVYTLIKGLKEKGLAPNPVGYQKVFIVESPGVVLELLRKKRQELESLTINIAADMPKYLASYRQGGERTQILFYEGQDKFLELYDRVLVEEAKETLYFGEAKNIFGVVGQERLQNWVKNRIYKKIGIRTLMLDDAEARSIPTDQKAFRETRIIARESGIELPASFQVFGRNVIFWQPMTPVAVVLQDEYIAQLMRTTFEILWLKGVQI